jgi:hypothetical protein
MDLHANLACKVSNSPLERKDLTMSTISGIGGGAWAAQAMPDMSTMRQRMFAKVDTDGSGGVDAAELQKTLDKVSERSGQGLDKASDLMTRWDSDGNGNLSSDELDTGMKSLLPSPSSTMEFAQMRGGHGMDGMQMGGMPPPPMGGSDDSTGKGGSSGSSSGNTDPADTNGDGVVSAGERVAADLKKLVESLTAAVDTNGDKSLGSDEMSAFLGRMTQSIDAMA